MTDTATGFQATPIRRGEEEKHFRDVKNFAHRRWRATRATNGMLTGVLVGSLITNVALSVAMTQLFPLVRIVPVFYWVQEDGSVDQAVSIDDPAVDKNAFLQASAWLYVRYREGYSYSQAQYSYDLVRSMSEPHVRATYEAEWFLPNGKDNPDSLQKKIGKNGQVNIEKIITRPIRDNVIDVSYRRIVEMYDEPARSPYAVCKPPACTTWTATVELYIRDKMPAGQKVGGRDDNPLGAIVTRYQKSEGAG